ncbi:MAG: FHA domain-containing protein [Hyphomicrobiaceae bacterium]
MTDKVYLSISNDVTGEHYVAGCRLPVRFGKHPDSDNQVLFDAKFRTISRVHGTIESTSRGLHYTDTSSNGSRVGGLVVRDAKVALSPRFEIEIGDYHVRPVEASPLTILTTEMALLELQRMELLPGRGVGVVRRGSTLAIADLNRWTEWDKPTVATFQIVADQSLLVVENADNGPPILINKSTVNKPRTVLSPLDVVEINHIRFEVLDPHMKSIVCSHETCQLLNRPPHEQNCKWCGRHLANTGAISRIL